MEIPESFYSIPYNALINPDNHPGDFSNLSEGANCLIFAYALLKYNGFSPPILWPIELWDDKKFTKQVTECRGGDMLFFGNNTTDAYWWHLGVSLGEEKVIHLSKEVGIPEITTISELTTRGSYKYFLGAKRIK